MKPIFESDEAPILGSLLPVPHDDEICPITGFDGKRIREAFADAASLGLNYFFWTPVPPDAARSKPTSVPGAMRSIGQKFFDEDELFTILNHFAAVTAVAAADLQVGDDWTGDWSALSKPDRSSKFNKPQPGEAPNGSAREEIGAKCA